MSRQRALIVRVDEASHARVKLFAKRKGKTMTDVMIELANEGIRSLQVRGEDHP